MKIFQLIFSLGSGGAEKITTDLCNDLSKEHEVYLCVVLKEDIKGLSFFKYNLNERVHYINLGCSKGINLKAFFSIFNLLTKIKPQVVHAHLNTVMYLYFPAIIFHKRTKFIHTLHSIAQKTIGFRWQKTINSFLYYNEFIVAVAISNECKSSFEDFYNHKKVVMIENGVSMPRATKLYANVKQEIDSYKKRPEDRVFIHVASFAPAKNQELLIHVFNKLIRDGFGVILIVIGKEFHLPSAKKLIEISEQGIFYLGPKKNIADYYMNSDVFVLSSLWEGLPMSLLEAMACGLIPVCTPAGGIPNVIKDESFGYVSYDFTENSLCDAVKKCLCNMDSFNRINLKNYFKSEFSIEKCSNQYLEAYNS